MEVSLSFPSVFVQMLIITIEVDGIKKYISVSNIHWTISDELIQFCQEFSDSCLQTLFTSLF